ncbi:unnamed protein product, partial [Allacma fusca]
QKLFHENPQKKSKAQLNYDHSNREEQYEGPGLGAKFFQQFSFFLASLACHSYCHWGQKVLRQQHKKLYQALQSLSRSKKQHRRKNLYRRSFPCATTSSLFMKKRTISRFRHATF